MAVDQKETDKGESIRDLFLGRALGISKEDYSKLWMHLLFLEGSNPPLLKENSQSVIETVRNFEGGIGYVWASEANSVEGVKVVRIIPVGSGKENKRNIR